MIDIHCHILPGIDDGPRDLETSLAMARMAAADGISHIVATPHIKNFLHPLAEISGRVEQLNTALRAENIPLKILPGGDVSAMLDPGVLRDYSINKTNYILAEFPHTHLPKSAAEILFRFVSHGFRPIITHPERNPSVVGNPRLLFDLLDENVLVQITAESLTGGFGRDMQQCALYLLQQGVVDFIATDGHSPRYRRPILSEGLKVAAKILGAQEARKLVVDNPAAVLSGEAVHG